MRVCFRHFSRHQLELLRDNINAQLLNDFGEYELQIEVVEPLLNPTYTASERFGGSNSYLDVDC